MSVGTTPRREYTVVVYVVVVEVFSEPCSSILRERERQRERERVCVLKKKKTARANAFRLKFLSLIFCLTSTHTNFSQNIKTGEEKITQQQQQQHQEANECGGCCSRRR